MELNRHRLIEELANEAIDSIDLKSLVAFYFDSQVEYLGKLADKELIEYAVVYGNYTSEEEILEEYNNEQLIKN
jgi:hypothetical protein